MHIPKTERNETLSPKIASGAVAAGFDLTGMVRRFGVPVFVFDTNDPRLQSSSVEAIGAARYPALGQIGQAVSDAVAYFESEEARRVRQGAGASPTPAYSRAELLKMTPAESLVEMPSINAAIASKSVRDLQKPKPAPETLPTLFTKSQVESMHQNTLEANIADINAAIETGQFDFAK